jgi:hypothetical protein
MCVRTTQASQVEIIKVKTGTELDCRVTKVRINSKVEVGTRGRWLCFWTAGREVRIGPLTPSQAEKLSEDLGYDAVC